jgi:hypothetical protein
MSWVLSVDPGLRHCGVALFGDQQLRWAALIKSPEKTVRGPAAWLAMAKAVLARLLNLPKPDVLVVEVPQVYSWRGQKGDQADLIELAGVDGALVGTIEHKTGISYLPRQWKGQVPKEVMNARVEAKLSEVEKGRIEACAPSLRHNVLDGVGIGLKYLGRL